MMQQNKTVDEVIGPLSIQIEYMKMLIARIKKEFEIDN